MFFSIIVKSVLSIFEFFFFFFKVSASRRKGNGCCAYLSESTLVPKCSKPSNVAQPGCSISGSSCGNSGNPVGLQAVITWNEYFNYVMILITAYLSLCSWIQSSFSTNHETEMYPPHFLFYFGGGWDFTVEVIVLIMMWTPLVSLQRGLLLTALVPGVVCHSHDGISAFLLL